MPILIQLEQDPKPLTQPRQFASYHGLILNWQARALEELARQLGSPEDELLIAALTLFLGLYVGELDFRNENLFHHEAPGEIVKSVTSSMVQAKERLITARRKPKGEIETAVAHSERTK